MKECFKSTSMTSPSVLDTCKMIGMSCSFALQLESLRLLDVKTGRYVQTKNPLNTSIAMLA